jgi:hypothetical protein
LVAGKAAAFIRHTLKDKLTIPIEKLVEKLVIRTSF